MSGRVNKFTGEYPQNYCFSYKQTRKKSLLLHKIRIFALKYLLGERINTTYYFLPRITRMQLLFVGLGVKCLEGTTERSDDNRGRSPRCGQLKWFCLEGSTPVAMYKVPNNCKLFQVVYVVVKTMPSGHNVRNRAFY